MPKTKKAKSEPKPKTLAKPKREQATKPEAEKLSVEVASLWLNMETSWYALGAKIKHCIEVGVPKALGQTVQVWMEKTIPGSTSRAFRALRIAKALKSVPEPKVANITEGNAYLLARLPEKERTADEWINRATVMSNDKFADKVEAAIEKKTGLKRDKFETVTLRLPVSVAVHWEKAQNKMARVLQLDTKAAGWRITVIEALAALVNDTPESRLKVEVVGADGPVDDTHEPQAQAAG